MYNLITIIIKIIWIEIKSIILTIITKIAVQTTNSSKSGNEPFSKVTQSYDHGGEITDEIADETIQDLGVLFPTIHYQQFIYRYYFCGYCWAFANNKC